MTGTILALNNPRVKRCRRCISNLKLMKVFVMIKMAHFLKNRR